MEDAWFGLDDAMELLRSRLAARRSRILLGDFPSAARGRARWPPAATSATSATAAATASSSSSSTSSTQVRSRTTTKSTESEMQEVKSGDYEEARCRLRQALDENVKLQAVISDLTQVNKRWQRYNNDRQMYVQKLLSTIQDQQEQINNMGEEKAFPGLQQSGGGGGGVEAGAGAGEGAGACPRPECKSSREERAKLEEQVELLEFQVKAHKEDWEAERNEKRQAVKDRDEAKAEHLEALRELYAIKGYHSESLNCLAKSGCCRHCKRLELEPPPSYNKPPFTTVRMGSSSSGSGACSRHAISLGGDLECDGEEFARYEELASYDSARETQGGPRSGRVCLRKARSAGEAGLVARGAGAGAAGAGVEAEEFSSYSHSSTAPLLAPAEALQAKHTVSVGLNVLLPVVKSSSAPERRSAAFRRPPKSQPEPASPGARGGGGGSRPRLKELLPPPPPAAPAPPAPADEGVETRTRESIACPNCTAVFPPDDHLSFLDHFDLCPQRAASLL